MNSYSKKCNNILILDKLYKKFGNTLVLDNISIVARDCDVIGLAGASGSGKSTLLRCIQGFEIPDSGVITYKHDINRNKIGFMFQDFQLFPHMTVLQNLIYAPNLHKKLNKKSSTNLHEDLHEDLQYNLLSKSSQHKSLKHKSSKNFSNNDIHAKKLLHNLGIADKIHAYPMALSGGQKQRVALARSLMMHPKLLLCDEPTSGLDVATIADVALLLQSVKDMEVTMIIASHDLDFLTKIATRIIILKNGKIACDVVPAMLDNPISQLKNYY